jgi:uncharacterized protein YecT (DUF1311 family)
MGFDWTIFDASHLGMLLGGAAVTAAGFFLKRLLSGAATQERITRYAGLADIASKMKAHGLSKNDVLAVEQFIRGKEREAEIAAEDEPVPEQIDESRNEPAGYWTQTAMNQRAAAAYRVADAQLRQVLLELEHYCGDEFYRAQKAWEEFRDRQVEFARSEWDGGSIAPLIAAVEAETLTRQRIAWAQATLEQRKR